MKREFENRVVIIGGDHHNTLAVIRCLGRMNIDICILVHSDKKSINQLHLASSKYAKSKIRIVEEDETSLLKCLQEIVDINEKQLILPCSDFAEYVIDNNFEALCNNYILPGFKNQLGKVAFLMDKYNQKTFADNKGIKMAKTWSVDANENKFGIPNDIEFPCIVKPEISAMGNKSDIIIASSISELKDSLCVFLDKGYKTVLIQKFLLKNYEICAYGVILENSPNFCGGIIKKINEYPPKGGGSLTFARFTQEKEISETVQDVLQKLYEEGYRGLYDIEFFVCQDAIYLNEINFRHSGNGYALIKNKVYAPYYWCMDALGKRLGSENKYVVENASYHMDEVLEIRLFRTGAISLTQCITSIFKSKAFAVFDLGDLHGTYGFLKEPMLSLLKKIAKTQKLEWRI